MLCWLRNSKRIRWIKSTNGVQKRSTISGMRMQDSGYWGVGSSRSARLASGERLNFNSTITAAACAGFAALGAIHSIERDLMGNYVTELTCIHCGSTYPGGSFKAAEGVWMTCPKCGPADGILDVGYDLDRVRAAWKTKPLRDRDRNHWRYSELLPLEPESVPYDWPVGYTPVIDSERLASKLGIRQLLHKEEGRTPTAWFQDRERSGGGARAMEVGATTIACASRGNASGSLAGLGAVAGLPTKIFNGTTRRLNFIRM